MIGRVLFGFAVWTVAAICADDAAAPLDLKPGLWETTLSIRTSGTPPMPPELAKLTPEQRSKIDAHARSTEAASPKVTVGKHCFRDADPSKEILLTFGSDRRGCAENSASPSLTAREIRLKCGEGSMQSSGTVRIEAKSREAFLVSSEWFATDGARKLTISSTATGKWLGAACDVKGVDQAHDAGHYDKLGREEIGQGRFKEAIDTLDQALALDPRRATSLNARGYAHLRLGDFATALADFNEAIRLRPDYANAYQNRAVARRHLGDQKGAAEDEKKASP